MPRRPLPPLLTLLLPLTALLAGGCETHTCQSACRKVYYECNGGTGMTPIVPGNDQEAAYDQCVEACTAALYSTSRSEGDDSGDVVASYNLHTPDDAMQFIDCVEHVDLEDPECVTDFDAHCPWIRW